MPVRRGGVRGAFAGLGDYVARAAAGFGQNALTTARWNDQQKQLAADKLTEYMLAHPERADDIAAAARAHWGLDLEAYRPSDTQLTSPLVAQVVNAKNELDLPSMDELVARMEALGRPGLLAPGPTARTFDAGRPATLPSTPLGMAARPGAQAPPEGAVLPSTSFSEGTNPLLGRLQQMRTAKLGAFGAQRDIEAGQRERVAHNEAYGRETGTTRALAEGGGDRAAIEEMMSEAREAGQNAPVINQLKVENFERMTPAEARRAAAIAGATERARIGVQQEAGVGEFADVGPMVESMAKKSLKSGDRYVNVDNFRGKLRDAAQRYAAQNGIAALDKKHADVMFQIDTARQISEQMFKNIAGSLPKDAAGRPVAGFLRNKLSRLVQVNPKLAAFGSWRAGAIKILRALAGAEGLRINNQEIQLSIQNDIPQETDTVATALQRLKNVLTMLDIQNELVFGRTYGVTPPPEGGPQ